MDLTRTFSAVAVISSYLLLGACAASKQEVATRLGGEFIGQNVDALVVKFGPPSSMFKMNNGSSSYVWQLSAVTDVDVDRGYGTASTRYCKVSAIASPTGIITQLNTEDTNAGGGVAGAIGLYGSMCAQRLGMQPN